MRVHARFALMTLRTCLAYWQSFLLGTMGRGFYLVATVAVWTALLRGGATVGGYDLPQMKAYLLVGFITALLGNAFDEWPMAGRIQSGMVAIDLTRPMDYQRMQFAQLIGGVAMDLVVIGVAGGTFVLLTRPIQAPADLGLLLVSLVLVVPIKFLLNFMASLLCFWTQNYHGVAWAKDALWWLLSGAMVPLALLPGPVQALASVLPFSAVMSTPALIYVGKLTDAGAARLIGLQVFWIVLLWALSRLAWRGASRQLTVHGG